MFILPLLNRIQGSSSTQCSLPGPESSLRCPGWHGPHRTYRKANPIQAVCVTDAPGGITENVIWWLWVIDKRLQSEASAIRCHQRHEDCPFFTQFLHALHGHEARHSEVFTHSLDDTINEKTSNFSSVPGYNLSSRSASSKHSNGPYQNATEIWKRTSRAPRWGSSASGTV